MHLCLVPISKSVFQSQWKI